MFFGYSHCPECSKTIIGKTIKPCKCGRKYDFYTRVVGYLANVKDTATSKASEIGDRINYDKPKNAKGDTGITVSNRADKSWKESYCV